MRWETLKMTLKLDKTQAEKYTNEVKEFFAETPDMLEGDELIIDYRVNITYFGEVARKLKTIQTLLKDKGVVLEADTEELLHGECLIQEVLNGIRDVVVRT
jgi:uncharacterized membrane-anchored protein YhcB (DUF1043 family)